eukprot:2886058-Rhodomonas_salina.1
MEHIVMCSDCLAVTGASYPIPQDAEQNLGDFLHRNEKKKWKTWWDKYKTHDTVVATIGRVVISFMKAQNWTEVARQSVEAFFLSLRSKSHVSKRLNDAYDLWQTAQMSRTAGIVAQYGVLSA